MAEVCGRGGQNGHDVGQHGRDVWQRYVAEVGGMAIMCDHDVYLSVLYMLTMVGGWIPIEEIEAVRGQIPIEEIEPRLGSTRSCGLNSLTYSCI